MADRQIEKRESKLDDKDNNLWICILYFVPFCTLYFAHAGTATCLVELRAVGTPPRTTRHVELRAVGLPAGIILQSTKYKAKRF